MSIVLKAAAIASLYHRGQMRKNNGRPFETHLIRVGGRTATRPGMTESDVAGAFLHDIIEDQAKTSNRYDEIIEVILKECGYETVNVVIDLTDPSKGSELPRAERKKMDRLHLACCFKNVKIIKLIDRIDNVLESISDVEAGTDSKLDFNVLYADESELLLNEALTGVDSELERELRRAIQRLREVCARRAVHNFQNSLS